MLEGLAAFSGERCLEMDVPLGQIFARDSGGGPTSLLRNRLVAEGARQRLRRTPGAGPPRKTFKPRLPAGTRPNWIPSMCNSDEVPWDGDLNACRVCGRRHEEPPWGADSRSPTFEICDRCGTEFGYEDATPDAAQAARERWLRSQRQT